jgi:hypothetical protein
VSRPRFARRVRGRRTLTLAFAPRLIIQLSGGRQISSSTNRASPRAEALPMVVVLLHNPTVPEPLSSRMRSGTEKDVFRHASSYEHENHYL